MPLQPVRKIPLSHRSITGKRPSQKTKTTHQFESALERDYLTLLEFDDEVDKYVVQPITIEYLHQDKLRHYTPDMMVYYKSVSSHHPLLVEIKYAAELESKKEYYAPKFNAAKQYARQHGYEFRVITEKEIRTVYLQNIKFLSKYHGMAEEVYVQKVMMAITQKERFTANDLPADDQQMVARMLYTLWQLLANKIITCDMHQPICMTSILWKDESK